MIRHSVFFWLNPDLTDDQKASFVEGMKALFDIDVVKKGSYATAAATPTRPVTDNTYDYALFLEFDSVNDHDAYQIDPDHDVFVQNFRQWFATVKIFDAEMA